jgi:formylglycine-generating enzyme required for sulfatase activity
VWRPAPGGNVELRDNSGAPIGTFDVEPFYVSQFPVTICQFDLFARSETYRDPRWWAELPGGAKNRASDAEPGTPNQPAWDVSWYEAIAYCRWLTEQIGYEVRLPTEAEWVQAATGGRQGYVYPWGPEWDPARANYKREWDPGRLLSVGLYPDGRSPVGAFDMSGNMWEWCLNEYDRPAFTDVSDRPRTSRGGAYFSSPREMAVTYRQRDNANGLNALGKTAAVCVRLVTSHPPPDSVPEPDDAE